ncbi:hypothetical protein AVEN_95934-1 [Araneus ventricosus]|uniref:THAP-type domain-containing protein n=1 Tax=Araneus ventricosus TaxID=182803 RepID=A0A4Y2J500_ARAVE|nr:hypothetical protein AVEN_95934-1 [Araneus ventricosus]
MTTYCAVVCPNNEKSGFKLYRLPVGERNEDRRKQWLHRIGRDKWIPNENSKLCEFLISYLKGMKQHFKLMNILRMEIAKKDWKILKEIESSPKKVSTE